MTKGERGGKMEKIRTSQEVESEGREKIRGKSCAAVQRLTTITTFLVKFIYIYIKIELKLCFV